MLGDRANAACVRKLIHPPPPIEVGGAGRCWVAVDKMMLVEEERQGRKQLKLQVLPAMYRQAPVSVCRLTPSPHKFTSMLGGAPL